MSDFYKKKVSVNTKIKQSSYFCNATSPLIKRHALYKEAWFRKFWGRNQFCGRINGWLKKAAHK